MVLLAKVLDRIGEPCGMYVAYKPKSIAAHTGAVVREDEPVIMAPVSDSFNVQMLNLHDTH